MAASRAVLYRVPFVTTMMKVCLFGTSVVMVIFAVVTAFESQPRGVPASRKMVGELLFWALAVGFSAWGVRCLRVVGARFTPRGIEIGYPFRRTRVVPWGAFDRFDLRQSVPYVARVLTKDGQALRLTDSVGAVTGALGRRVHRRSLANAQELVDRMNLEARKWLVPG